MIFNLFKSKPTLKELIPKGFVDIHSHILPGIDDGAKNVKESIELISEMKKMGFSKIIGTPHSFPGLYNNTTATIKNSYNMLVSNLTNQVKINYASEYMLDNSLIKKVKKKKILCLKNKYVLVEMSYLAAPINLKEIIYEINVNGYIPILAHPERYIFFHNDYKKFKKLKDMGCLFQGNLLSYTGYYGKHIEKISVKLINDKFIDFVGSDIHSSRHLRAFNRKIVNTNINSLQEIIENNNIFY